VATVDAGSDEIKNTYDHGNVFVHIVEHADIISN
jgi:hypothetical protein